MVKQNNIAIDAQAVYQYLPSDSDDMAADYNFPALSFGIRYHFNHGITMYKGESFNWPEEKQVPYDSKMGNIVSFYISFQRPILRSRLWEIDYHLGAGTAYSRRKYDTKYNIDNELIGSRWLIFFCGGLSATRQISNHWGIKGGLEFYHHSNGAVNRPNKGANTVAPTLSLRYTPQSIPPDNYTQAIANRKTFSPYLYAFVAASAGLHTMLEEWQITQYQLSPSDENYRTDKFKVYAAYALQADLLYRYARRWASGIGIDVFYADYYKRAEQINEEQYGESEKLDPWSIGIAAKHEVFFHRLNLYMGIGFYLHRNMGTYVKALEKRYYERIGIGYTLPFGVRIGIDVKAHFTKADLTEITIGCPLRLTKQGMK